MSDELLYFNGVNAGTGDYLVPPLPASAVVSLARGETPAPDHLLELRWRNSQKESHYGVKEGVDARDLAQTGWGVIFASDTPPAVRDALAGLLAHRRAQANRLKERYREYSGTDGFRPGDSKNMFLARQGAGPGPVDPDRVPYYLLIVGDPEKIPYSFQYQLDVAYAVGRIAFDTPDEYAAYAQSVVRAETENLALPRRAAFFGVSNPDDPSTQLSSERLVKPLAAKMQADQRAWTFDTYLAADASKSRLESLLGGSNGSTPSLLFTASHGLGFDLGDPRQLRQQGALLCQEWPGPHAAGNAVPQTMYYAADDVPSTASLFGLIAFHFACFGMGTPRYDEFTHLRNGVRDRAQIAPASFLAKLPRRLLAHPSGGALAVIGHVDRTWGSSFVLNQTEQLAVFESTLKRLMEGHPIGSAVEFFNERYAELATSLSSELEDLKYGKRVDPTALAALWTANNDARGYAVLGDPAVRLMLAPLDGAPAPASPQTITIAAPAPTTEQATPVSASPAPAPPETSAPTTDQTVHATVVPAPASSPPSAVSASTAGAAAAASVAPTPPDTLTAALKQLTTALAELIARSSEPIEISTSLGDARLTSLVRADGGVTTTVQGIIGDPLLNTHTRLVSQAGHERLESLTALLDAARATLDLLSRAPPT